MKVIASTHGKAHKHFYQGLDAHGYAGLDAPLALSFPLASFDPAGHPLREKWPMGNVGTLLAAMGEVWQHCNPKLS
jgi:hypothetical protein